MRLSYLILIPLGVLAAMLFLVGWVLYNPSEAPAASMPSEAPKQQKTPVTLADINQVPELPDGAGKDAFLANCLTCHTARYVTMQPRFPAKVWKAEVGKMVSAYKAPIAAAQQEQIAGYLAANFGPVAGKQ